MVRKWKWSLLAVSGFHGFGLWGLEFEDSFRRRQHDPGLGHRKLYSLSSTERKWKSWRPQPKDERLAMLMQSNSSCTMSLHYLFFICMLTGAKASLET